MTGTPTCWPSEVRAASAHARPPMTDAHPRTSAKSAPPSDRERLMEQHREARRRRDSAGLGSDEFRSAAEEVARIEIAIAQAEEPPVSGE